MTARELALRCLMACEKEGAWADGYLKRSLPKAGLDARDAALCARMTYGVLQNKLLLDYHIDRLSTTKTDKMAPFVAYVLRLGLYQLLFLDRVPSHAAVSQSVELVKGRNSRAAGLVNAVLRAFVRESDHPIPADLSTRYSHPAWLVKEFSRTLPPEEVEALLAANNAPAPTVAQVNTLKTTPEALAAELTAAGVSAVPHPWLPDCLELAETGNLEGLTAFREGKFYIQDGAAKLAVLAANPQPGMKVLDACAAPGGKSFAAAIHMGCKGEILSCDIHRNKVKLIEEGAARLGLPNITAQVRDAKAYDAALAGAFDLVIADVPCSGLGIIRKKPDIRYKDPEPLAGLPEVQLAILRNVSRYVKPGGTLLYATCTVLERENEAVVCRFLEENADFQLSSFLLPGREADCSWVTLWPHRDGTDGFFFAKLQRKLDTGTVQCLSDKYGLTPPEVGL